MIAPLIPAMPYRQYACLPSSFLSVHFASYPWLFYTTSQVRWSPVQTHRHKSTTNPFHVIHFLLLVLCKYGRLFSDMRISLSEICFRHFHPAKQILPSPCLCLFLLSVWHLVCLHVVNIHLVQSHTKACNAGTAYSLDFHSQRVFMQKQAVRRFSFQSVRNETAVWYFITPAAHLRMSAKHTAKQQ